MIYSCNMKNQICKTEDHRYEIWGTTPFDVTKRIEEEGCRCLSHSLLWNPKPKFFDHKQLKEIREKLPNWLSENASNFSKQDKEEFIQELAKMTDGELLQKLIYQYSFFRTSQYEEIYVFTLKIANIQAYCINYSEIYSNYNDKDIYPEGDEFYDGLKKYYPIIENEAWAENEFGDSGIIPVNNKSNKQPTSKFLLDN